MQSAAEHKEAEARRSLSPSFSPFLSFLLLPPSPSSSISLSRARGQGKARTLRRGRRRRRRRRLRRRRSSLRLLLPFPLFTLLPPLQSLSSSLLLSIFSILSLRWSRGRAAPRRAAVRSGRWK